MIVNNGYKKFVYELFNLKRMLIYPIGTSTRECVDSCIKFKIWYSKKINYYAIRLLKNE